MEAARWRKMCIRDRRYCFAGEEDWDKLGKLVCMGCGRLIPLECSKMADFLEHIYKEQDRKSTRLNSSHSRASRMPSSA